MNRVAIDGLWRCLCPSIDAIVISRSPVTLSGRCQTSTRPCSGARSRKTCCSTSRNIHSSARLEAGTSWATSTGNHIPRRRAVKSDTHATETIKTHNDPQFFVPIANSESKPLSYSHVDDIPNSEIHEKLWNFRSKPDSFDQIETIVRYLIQERGEEPNLVHYDALIRANADPSRGTLSIVIELLKQMKEAHIGADSGFYHGVLEVLTNHPNFAIREEILQEMNQRWLPLSPEGRHNVVLGLLRDQNLELAMEALESMQQEDIPIQPWLYDIFIHRLCEGREWDEALSLLRTRVDSGELFPSEFIWQYLLDSFSAASHYNGTIFIWQLKVATRHLNPSDGTCTQVLNVAARYADPDLATSVLSLLSDRKAHVMTHQYEAVLEAYINSSDIKTAFRILTIMVKAGEILSDATTRPIYQYLVKDVELPEKAWKILELMRKETGFVPTAAANVVIEAVGAFGDVELAVDLYKKLHLLCSNGPNIDTFNVLLKQLHQTKSKKDLAMFLAAEMQALGIKPNRLTYDRLIIICLEANDYEDAFKYLDEMITMGDIVARTDPAENSGKIGGWFMRRGTTIKFLECLLASGDERALALMEEWDRRDDSSDSLKTAEIREKLRRQILGRAGEFNSSQGQQLVSLTH